MTSTSEYSQTLQNITDAKLEELSNKRQIFLQRKAAALQTAESVESPIEKIRALADGVKVCFNLPVKDGRVVVGTGEHQALAVSLANLERFLKQAEYDPAVSPVTVERWRQLLLRELDTQTLKYEYATLFAQLTMEWLSVQNPQKGPSTTSADDFEKLASTAKMESRREWEKFVFTPAGRDPETILAFLTELFAKVGPKDLVDETQPAPGVPQPLETLREKVASFEASLASLHMNRSVLEWVINGLRQSDLMTDPQRAVLRSFQRDPTILDELCDVLNMRLANIPAWSWGAAVGVQQRRQMNGTYEVRMQEDLIQAIFLQYLGVKWSVFMKSALNDFRKTRDAWQSVRARVPAIDKKRRAFFLNNASDKPSLQITKEEIYRKAYFVSQLRTSEWDIRTQAQGEEEADAAGHIKRKRAQPMVQSLGNFGPPGMARARKALVASEEEESDEDMGFGLFDGDEPAPTLQDADQSYESRWGNSVKAPTNPSQAKQNLLRLLTAETAISKRLHGELTCLRAQYESLFSSLPHVTILTVLRFLGVSEQWRSFFEKFLTAPLRFVDERDAEPRTRRRGTPGSHVLSELFGETTLFCLDVMVNQDCRGELLWRVHDDLWFWSREQDTCVTAWQAIERFNETMGIAISPDKTGSAHITTQPRETGSALHPALPRGKIRWGMLYLNALSGQFEIDQEMVDEHIKELRRQLDDKQGSIFGWIQAWNSYASTFFTYNFGTPAHAFGQAHVDRMLQTHERIQREIFASASGEVTGDSSVLTYLRDTIRTRFGTDNIPDGYFFLPIDLGGLELSSPFIDLVALRDAIVDNPDSLMDQFFAGEKAAYQSHKRRYDELDKERLMKQRLFRPDDADHFMSFEEYTRHRECLDFGFSRQLVWVYDQLLQRPQPQEIGQDGSGPVTLGLKQLKSQTNLSGIQSEWSLMSSYWKWLAQLYGPEIVERFGGFNIVDPGLLPIGLVSQFRSGRVSWTEE